MRKNDIITTIVNGKEVKGMIALLNSRAIVVQLFEPREVAIGRSFPSKLLDQKCCAVKEKDCYIATPEGEEVAQKLLVKLYKQLYILINNRQSVEAFINNYITKRDELLGVLKGLTTKELQRYKEVREELSNLLFDMQRKTFPEIKDIEMDEIFLENFSVLFLGKNPDLINKKLCF